MDGAYRKNKNKKKQCKNIKLRELKTESNTYVITEVTKFTKNKATAN